MNHEALFLYSLLSHPLGRIAAGFFISMLFYVAIMLIFFETPNAHTYLWAVIGFSFITSIMYIVMFKALNKPVSGTPTGHS